MTVDASIGLTYDRLASRERDTVRAFYPGAIPENPDVAASDDGTRIVNDPLSIALPPQAYAITVDANGKRAYTRDGAFHLQDGVLVDAMGDAVEGYAGPQAPLAPLRVDSIDLQLERVTDVRIEADGRLTYGRSLIDPRTGERSEQRKTAGRIALARFPAGSSLHAVDAIHLAASRDLVPYLGVPEDGSFGPVTSHRLVKSHINLDASLVKLQESYIAFDALRAAKKTSISTQKTATDLIK